MASPPANDCLDRVDNFRDWKLIAKALPAMDPATAGRGPPLPLVLFKLGLRQLGYDFSDPTGEERVSERLSRRRLVGWG